MLGELLDGPLALDVPLEAQLPKRLLQHSGHALPQLGDDPLDPVQQHLCPCRLMGRGPVKEVQMGGGDHKSMWVDVAETGQRML